MNKPILVTGAAGFVGSFVAARLADMGHAVIGCDNFNDYYPVQLKHDRVAALLEPRGIRCVTMDIADAGQVAALFEEFQPKLVVHLAAQAGVRYSLQNPAAYIQSNLVGFGNILEACRRHRTEHLLYASSSSVYGANVKVPFAESDRTDEPVSLYAATKKSNELMAYSYSHLYGLPMTGLRFFTVYGPWGRPDMAYFSFTKKILAGEAIPVFAGGELERDFTYIDDIVEGVVRLLFKPQAAQEGKPPHAVFNIGNHQPIKVKDFIATLEDVLDRKASIDWQPMQPGDVPATYADTDRLRDWVGFAPSTPLAKGLAAFRDWYNSRSHNPPLR
ncbi:NAD-dependent epimerase/dehydratase family protein [Noviherbaspirillum pedocola]|uniref:NAD-dependent epimerase/dehydratase family protein n=1 Tax=Noviherbaspirillum pedocola TaxID=2801341 RepID=A0A934W752_9BURK|nr:NAD-dependent epimerase/dehydratase family protein [Noviherbaspirillum pedocola]MBK4734289.1 NAD-dependent epimerase/dehydratase family protein [Noviherbaspirillum pedocola]